MHINEWLECRKTIFLEFTYLQGNSKGCRFTENDAWLAEEIQDIGKRYYFVRSHVDQDICNDRRAHPNSHDPEKQLEIIRKDCEINLEGHTHDKIYLIDSLECEKYDFDSLVAALTIDIERMKADVLVASLSSVTKGILEMKWRSLFRRIQCVAFQAGMMCTAESAEKIIRDVLKQESKYYCEVFDIDDDTLRADQELFRLSDLAADKRKEQLKKINKRFMRSRVEGIVAGIKQYQNNFRSELDEIEIDHKNFIALISNMLVKYMTCLYQFASNLFETVPIQIAKSSAIYTDGSK
ncbi:T-cell-specific guanine nucleotide triphosphate-binding protein 2-like [Mercenaria mercenaria]|uniref:T-cell-specific guanine nucleotide triphosphate-binding protein 2-like n=1 Tax=Mercenaria mercenaria TaxID=6596 RepID=UPI00234F725B|nr:T-cell-specific guanine nucleotide triphosphate-binding protein 2-like [Mercenaria mercenaria]